MSVIGLNFTRMEAQRSSKPVKGEIQINTTPKIVEVREVDIPSIKEKALSLDFEFETTYSQDVGSIRIDGSIMFVADDSKGILDSWKKDKKVPEDVSVEVLNHLFRRCMIKVASLADDLNLPPPINLPVVKKADK